MSTSRKRPATGKGKAPAKEGGSNPSIPRTLPKHARECYQKALPRNIKSTKFVCKNTLVTLGVLEGVVQLFRNIGWENFLDLSADTYELPTREFLASCGRNAEDSEVAFQLMGEAYFLSFAQVNAIMGTPTANTHKTPDELPSEFNHETFWREITGLTYSCAGRDKATSIIHPCLRIAHRILVCTVFARKEAGQVTKNELFFLWCMTRRDNPRPIPDFASFFFQKCRNMKAQTTGDICIGGFVTLLARALDIEIPSDLEPVDDKNLIDFRALTNMHHIRKRPDGRFTWYCPQGIPYLILPDPRLYNFNPGDRDQWRIARTITQEVHEEAIPQGEEMHVDHEPMQAPMQAPPQGYYQLPPNFNERFDALCVSNQIMAQQMHHVWGWHQSQNHFENIPLPPPYPYPPPTHPYPLHLTLTLTLPTLILILLPIPRYRYFALPPSIEDNAYF